MFKLVLEFKKKNSQFNYLHPKKTVMFPEFRQNIIIKIGFHKTRIRSRLLALKQFSSKMYILVFN